MSRQELVRAIVVYAGDVQGVGFRMTAVGLVENAPIVGWVMNQGDGSVRLEVEGQRAHVEDFLKRVRTSLTHRIHDESIAYHEPLRCETAFTIRY